MKEVYLIRTLNGLVPGDDASEADMRTLPFGKPIRAKLTVARNPRFHNKCMALIRLAFDNQTNYTDFDIFYTYVKMQVGHVEYARDHENNLVVIPKSIAFHKMDEKEFEHFYERVLTAITEFVMKGVNRGELEGAVLESVRNFQSVASQAERDYNESLAND